MKKMLLRYIIIFAIAFFALVVYNYLWQLTTITSAQALLIQNNENLIDIHNSTGRICQYHLNKEFDISNWTTIWYPAIQSSCWLFFLIPIFRSVKTNPNRRAIWVIIIAYIFLTIPRLANNSLWGDEASTGVYAKNLIQTGKITCWDGKNILSYAHGFELDDNLTSELRTPHLPTYVAAASMWLFGENTFAARFPFVLIGAASIYLVYLFSKKYIGGAFPHWLPAMLLALNVQFLLFMPQCRYYALSLSLTLALLLCFMHKKALLLIVVSILLIQTQYLNAAVGFVLIALFMCNPKFRDYKLFLIVFVTYAAVGLRVLSGANPFDADYSHVGQWLSTDLHYTVPARFWEHLLKYIRDLSTHQIFSYLVIPIILLYNKGYFLLICLFGYLVATVLIIPNSLGAAEYSEIRYIVPIMFLTSVLTAVAVYELYLRNRLLSYLFVLFLLFNTPQFLFAEYYRSGNDELINYLHTLPPDIKVKCYPNYFAMPPLFYGVDCKFVDILSRDKNYNIELPDYVFTDDADIVVIPHTMHKKLKLDNYRIIKTLGGSYNYTTRPEYMLHDFNCKDKKSFIILEKK